MIDIEINSLSEYIEKIENIDSNKYYFRGECDNFTCRQASAYRESHNTFIGLNPYPVGEMLEEYYNEIAYKIPSEYVRDFVAFAQHYKLPTNLLDISTSPLVALFFACLEADKNIGYVYLYDKEKTLDFTNIVQSYKYNAITSLFFDNSIEKFLPIVKLFDKYFRNNRKELDLYKKRIQEILKKENHQYENSLNDGIAYYLENSILYEIAEYSTLLLYFLNYIKDIKKYSILTVFQL